MASNLFQNSAYLQKATNISFLFNIIDNNNDNNNDNDNDNDNNNNFSNTYYY